jgi:ribosomal protein S18 acetylase RimI-like enzyme
MPMIAIDSFRDSDLQAIIGFVQAIQEHERVLESDLKPGVEIGAAYAQMLIQTAAGQEGSILVARAAGRAVGFVCAWIEQDPDPLIREECRPHAYVSDIFVETHWRRQGVGRLLMNAVEKDMAARGCRRIRVCSKASNAQAIEYYGAAGFKARELIFSKDLASR